MKAGDIPSGVVLLAVWAACTLIVPAYIGVCVAIAINVARWLL